MSAATMIKANFHDEKDLAQHASRGGQANQEARRRGEHIDAVPLNIPYWWRCGYDDFCQLMVKRHGAHYLRRPNGEPLAGVPDSAFVLPAERLKPVNPRQLPPDIYTGSAAQDIQVETKKNKAQGRWPGPTLRHIVLEALRLRPMTLREICEHTGIRNAAVKNVLHRYRGTYFRNDNHYWSEVQNTVEV